MRCSRHLTLVACLFSLAGPAASGTAQVSIARTAMDLFAEHCFSPYMTADKAESYFASSGASYDFYDLDPFSNSDPSPATGRTVTPGTDRRCEISFPGNHADTAATKAASALEAEGITKPAGVPAGYQKDAGTTLLAARKLNPARTAVVQVGTRDAGAGTETFMLVERLVPYSGHN